MLKTLALTCTSAIALGAAMPAAAQEAVRPATSHAETQATAVDEIVVTARRVNESLQDVPLAVSAFTGEQLERQAVRNVQDLAGTVPNLALPTATTDPTALSVTIRGQRQPDNLLTVDPAVGVYIDEVAIPRPAGLKAALIDVQRVEVLRGPQGTLYGRNTTGGAFSVITRDPKPDLGGSVTASVGNLDLREIGGVLNLPIGEQSGLRIVGQFSDRGGYGTDAIGTDLGAITSSYGRAVFRSEIGNLTLRLSADYADIESAGLITKLGGLVPAAGTAPAGASATRQVAREQFGDTSAASLTAAAAILQGYASNLGFYDTAGTVKPIGDYSGGGAGLILDYKISDTLSVKSVTGYRSYERHTLEDLDGTPYAILSPDQVTKDDFLSQEIQLQGTYDRFNFVAGVYISQEEGDDSSHTVSLRDVGNGALNLQDSAIENRSRAVYGQIGWKLQDALTLTVGARYTSEDRILVSRNRNSYGTCNVPVDLRDDPAICKGTFDDTFEDPSYLVSLDYQAAPGVLVYAKYSTGFRSGGQQFRGTSNPVTFQPFLPETVEEYEVGLKSDWFDRRLRVNLAAFSSEYSDVQRTAVTLVGTTAATVFTNAANATLKGFEAEVVLRPTSGLTLSANTGYVDAKYDEFIDFTGDRTNEAWPSPDWTYSVSANYVHPTNFGEVIANIAYTGQSDYSLRPESKVQQQVMQEAYGLLSARLALSIDAWNAQVSVFGRNLADKKYNTAAVGIESIGYNIVIPAEPRTFGIQLTKRFGGE